MAAAAVGSAVISQVSKGKESARAHHRDLAAAVLVVAVPGSEGFFKKKRVKKEEGFGTTRQSAKEKSESVKKVESASDNARSSESAAENERCTNQPSIILK